MVLTGKILGVTAIPGFGPEPALLMVAESRTLVPFSPSKSVPWVATSSSSSSIAFIKGQHLE